MPTTSRTTCSCGWSYATDGQCACCRSGRAVRPSAPRLQANWLSGQIGLAVAVKHQSHMPFRWELLAIVGPFALAIGLVRNRQ